MKHTGTLLSILLVAFTVTNALAYDIPSNVKAFANRIKDGKCKGGKVLKDGFYSEDGGPKSEYRQL